jgi:hypothetical protein
MYGVVIPNRFPEVIAPLVESINRLIPDPKPEIVIVADNHSDGYGFRAVPYPDPFFVFSKSANTGIRELGTKDVILLNDDCVLLEKDFFDRLHAAFLSQDRVGILSPLVVGCVGNRLQRWHERAQCWKPGAEFQDVRGSEAVCFPCVYISRAMLNEIGPMNEAYAGYGRDDWDMCVRARAHGWRTTVTSLLRIQHADGSEALGPGRGKSWSTSFVKRWAGGIPPPSEISKYLRRNQIERLKS